MSRLLSSDASGLGLGPGLSFVAAASGTGASVTSVAVNVPAATQNGDFIYFVAIAWNSTISASGFTSIDSAQGNQSTNHKYASFWKIASNEGSTWTMSFGTATWPVVVAYVLRNTTASPVKNHSVLANASAYTTSLTAPSTTVNATTDGVLFSYSGVNSGATGSETIALPGTLFNPLAANNTTLGGAVGVGWGRNVGSPGAATDTGTGLDYMDGYADLASAGPFSPQALFSQAANRASTW